MTSPLPDMGYSVWVDVVVGGGRRVRLGLKESRFPTGGASVWVCVCGGVQA